MAKAFRDLIVWQKGMELTTLIYLLTEAFPKHEIYGLTSQMRRAAVSIPSNIAEGSARGSKKDFCQFVRIALGSSYELQTQIQVARNLGFASEIKLAAAEALCIEVSKMLKGLAHFLSTPKN